MPPNFEKNLKVVSPERTKATLFDVNTGKIAPRAGSPGLGSIVEGVARTDVYDAYGTPERPPTVQDDVGDRSAMVLTLRKREVTPESELAPAA